MWKTSEELTWLRDRGLGAGEAMGTSEAEMRMREASHWKSKIEFQGAGESNSVNSFRRAKDLEVSLWFSTLSALWTSI